MKIIKRDLQQEINRYKTEIAENKSESIELQKKMAINQSKRFQLTDFVETLKGLLTESEG